LHKTAPQASFIVFAWLVSHITYIPEIHQSQVWIILLGGSDTGKSDAMNCVAMLVPRAVLVREDNQSKMAIVENAEVGT
jgi:GTP-binding protein EngB required for normal cell division